MGIQNRVALITGSASGMGRQTARRLAENGAKVVINDIVPEKVEETVAEFKADGLTVMGQVADISSKESVDAMVQAVVDNFGSLDILVNNAGMERAGALRKLTEQDWDLTVDINLKGAFLCSQGGPQPYGSQQSWPYHQYRLPGLAGRAGTGRRTHRPRPVWSA